MIKQREDWSQEVAIKPRRFGVTGPDASGDFELTLYGSGIYGVDSDYTYLDREQANALIRVLQRGLNPE